MKDYGEFHDGDLEGLWIDGDAVHVHVRSYGRKFALTASGAGGETKRMDTQSKAC
jgi:hypothetical protein